VRACGGPDGVGVLEVGDDDGDAIRHWNAPWRVESKGLDGQSPMERKAITPMNRKKRARQCMV
jgi:hypothetical protein